MADDAAGPPFHPFVPSSIPSFVHPSKFFILEEDDGRVYSYKEIGVSVLMQLFLIGWSPCYIYNYNMCVRPCVRLSVRGRFRVLMDRRNRPGQSDSEKGNGYNSAGVGGAREVFFFFFWF